MENWKIELGLDECDNLCETYVQENDMPFIPRIGEYLWPSRRWCDAMEEKVKECWRENGCKDCPYIYCHQKSEDDISLDDQICVTNIVHDVDKKRVLISLSSVFKEE